MNRVDGARRDLSPAAANGDRPDAPHPTPDQATGRIARRLEADGEHWVAYISGRGAYGSGALGLANIDAIHFEREDAPGEPVLEALLPGGRFADLHATELLEVFRSARRIVIPDGGAAATPRRFNLEEDLS
jgi:hypothetical protein